MNPLQTLTDNQLIQSYKAGNTAALNTLILRHKDKIFTSIYLLTKDKYASEDIFQELFVKIIDKLNNGSYKEEGKFIQWAMCIAHNMAIDHFRVKKRKPSLKTGISDDAFEELDFAENSIDQKMVREEINLSVRKLLDALPQEQREVIILRHYADLSFKEIARLTNCSINTALGRMHYGLSNIRKMNRSLELTY